MTLGHALVYGAGVHVSVARPAIYAASASRSTSMPHGIAQLHHEASIALTVLRIDFIGFEFTRVNQKPEPRPWQNELVFSLQAGQGSQVKVDGLAFCCQAVLAV